MAVAYLDTVQYLCTDSPIERPPCGREEEECALDKFGAERILAIPCVQGLPTRKVHLWKKSNPFVLSVTNAAHEEERLRGKPPPYIKVSHMVLDRVPNVAHYHLHSGPESLQTINVFLLSSSGLEVDTIVMVILLHLSENGLVNLLM